MTDRLSPQHETEILERAEAATEGPWLLHEDEGDTFRAPAWEIVHPSGNAMARVRDWAPADAAFLVHAPEDVAVLLAELAAVRAERDEAQAQLAELSEQHADAVRVSAALSRRLSQEQLAGSALYAAMTMPTTPQQRQDALDKFTAVAQQTFAEEASS